MAGTLPVANEVLNIQASLPLRGNEHAFSMTAEMPSGPDEVLLLREWMSDALQV